MKEEIPAIDLAAEHASLLAELEAAARRVLISGDFILGAEVAAFEREAAQALGVAHAVGVSSGSDALVAMLLACGVGPGDEVVTTPFSFFATAEAIARVGARPRFADIEADTLNLDPDAASRALGPRTRAALVVHLFGRVARTGPLEAALSAHGLPLLEDAAQAAGARRAGTIGRAAALSFFPSKNLGGFGDGGMVLTQEQAFAERVALLRNHGSREKGRHLAVGGNFRLDELQAALLRVKLSHLPRLNDRRRAIAARYMDVLAGLPLCLPLADPGCVWHQFVVRVPGDLRDSLEAHLRSQGIGARVYYRQPLHLQPALAALGHGPGDFPETERAAAEVLALPIHAQLTDGQAGRVAAAVRAFFSA